jgi:hypothetical protein
MADYSDEFDKGQKNKTTLRQKKSANTSAVQFIVDPPGALEPTSDRRRQGMQRIAWRSSRKPNVDSFITLPMMAWGAVWTGSTPDDFTKAKFDNRMDWELNAPRFLVVPPKPGETVEEGQFVMPLGMKDFWYDKAMYGKVDLNQIPMYLSEAFLLPLTELDSVNLAPSFVAHAFRAFEKDWVSFWNRNIGTERSLITDAGKFQPASKGNIPMVKAWQSVHPLYHTHMSEMFTKFQRWLGIEHRIRKVLTFKDFVQYFMYFLDAFAPSDFVTRGAFIMSRKCPRSISGWQLDLAGGDPNDDIVKKQEWLADPNFEVWVAKLRQYGFSVDFNIPWLIVADVNSAPMRDFIRDYAVEGKDPYGVSKKIPTLRQAAKDLIRQGTESSLKLAESYDKAATYWQTKNLDMMFRTCYYRTDHTDMSTLMNYILSWWNDYATAFPVERIVTYAMNEKGPANQTITIEKYRERVEYDASANPSVENLKDPYSLLAGKTIYRASGKRSAGVDNPQPLKKASWDVWVSTFGADFPAKFYFFVRAREASCTWSQKVFDKHVKILRELQKSLDGKAALDYINEKTKRLPSPGGNPPLRQVEHPSKAYNVYESRERELAGRGMFILRIK